MTSLILEYKHLLGKRYIPGRQDCYSCLRDFYSENFALSAPDYVRPSGWVEAGLDLYTKYVHEEGFEFIETNLRSIEVGDVIMMSLHGTQPTHAAAYLGNNDILHHPYNQFSIVEAFRTGFKTCTVAIVRHPDVYKKVIDHRVLSPLDLSEHLNPAWREKLDHARRKQAEKQEALALQEAENGTAETL